MFWQHFTLRVRKTKYYFLANSFLAHDFLRFVVHFGGPGLEKAPKKGNYSTAKWTPISNFSQKWPRWVPMGGPGAQKGTKMEPRSPKMEPNRAQGSPKWRPGACQNTVLGKTKEARMGTVAGLPAGLLYKNN